MGTVTDYLKVEDTFCSWQFHKFLLFVIIMSLKTVGNPMKTKTSETSEKDLVSKSKVTPDDVLALKEITDTYLCSPDANTFGIDFTRFKIRDMETNTVLFEIAKPPNLPDTGSGNNVPDTTDPNAGRFVRYHFTPEFLRLQKVGATVDFSIGPQPIKDFRMIERHFFRNKMLKSFDLDFAYPTAKTLWNTSMTFPNWSLRQSSKWLLTLLKRNLIRFILSMAILLCITKPITATTTPKITCDSISIDKKQT